MLSPRAEPPYSTDFRNPVFGFVSLIEARNIRLLGQPLGEDGRLYRVLPDGEKFDLTPQTMGTRFLNGKRCWCWALENRLEDECDSRMKTAAQCLLAGTMLICRGNHLVAQVAVPQRLGEVVMIEGIPSSGWLPVLYLSRNSSGYSVTVVLRSADEGSRPATWLRATPEATCCVELAGLAGQVAQNRALSREQAQRLPPQITVQDHLQKFPRRRWSWMWIRFVGADDTVDTVIDSFAVRLAPGSPDSAPGLLRVQLCLYRVGEDKRSAHLVKFKPFEINLPPWRHSPRPDHRCPPPVPTLWILIGPTKAGLPPWRSCPCRPRAGFPGPAGAWR